jgi:hypothetical protein
MLGSVGFVSEGFVRPNSTGQIDCSEKDENGFGKAKNGKGRER